MDTDEEERIVTRNRLAEREKRTDICKNLNRSRGLLSKCVNRYKTGKEDCYSSKSKAPKNLGKKTMAEIENAVVNIRKTLMDNNEHESKYLVVPYKSWLSAIIVVRKTICRF